MKSDNPFFPNLTFFQSLILKGPSNFQFFSLKTFWFGRFWKKKLDGENKLGFWGRIFKCFEISFAQFPSFLNEEPTLSKTVFRYCWCLTKVKKLQLSPMGRFGGVLVNTVATCSRGRGFNSQKLTTFLWETAETTYLLSISAPWEWGNLHFEGYKRFVIIGIVWEPKWLVGQSENFSGSSNERSVIEIHLCCPIWKLSQNSTRWQGKSLVWIPR